MPTGTRSTRSRKGGAGDEFVGIETQGLTKFLNATARQLGPSFNRELRKASQQVAAKVVEATQASAGSHPSPQLYATIVKRSLRARRDRLPTIRVSSSSMLNLSHEPAKFGPRGSRKKGRKHRVAATDVWYGAEFGGGARKTTRQFPPHLGGTGYVFYPTVRRMGPQINVEYLDAIEKVLATISGGP